LQEFTRREAEEGVDLDFLLGLLWQRRRLGRAAAECLLQAVMCLVALRRQAFDLGQHHVHDAAEQIGIAPEHVESLVEKLPLLATIDKNAGQRPIEVLAATDAGVVQGVERRQHLMRSYRHAGGAQHPRKVHHVLGEAAALGRRHPQERHGPVPHPPSRGRG
jgi:hypothetical protein